MNSNILALDVGERRVGIAMASYEARLASPLTTLERGEDFWPKLRDLVKSHNTTEIVLGYPRSMEGHATHQTQEIEKFNTELHENTGIKAFFQDETLTSVKAREELESKGKPYNKSDIDSLAATYILNDYLESKS